MCCTPDIPDAPDLPAPPAAADYGPALALQTESMKYQTGLMEKQTELAERQAKLGDQAFKFWEGKVAPLQAKVVKDASRGLPTAPAEAGARNAVIQSTAPALRNAERSLAAKGVDPSSPMAVAAKQNITGGTGRMAGAAQYAGRKRIEDLNRARRQNAYRLGANLPNQAVAGFGSAAGIIGRAGAPVANTYSQIANTQMTQIQQESQLANQAWSLQTQSIMQDYNRDVSMAQAEAGAWNQLFTGATSAAVTTKVVLACIAEGAELDSLPGLPSIPIEFVRVGDIVLGKDGVPCVVVQVRHYAELHDAQKLVPFYRLVRHDGRVIPACAKHIIAGKPMSYWHATGAALPLPGVLRSYDVLTNGLDGGYRIAGIPVDSMIEVDARAAHAEKGA